MVVEPVEQIIMYIYLSDACHDLAWCLDACVRDKHLDSQQTNKLKNILEATKKSKPEVNAGRFKLCSDSYT